MKVKTKTFKEPVKYTFGEWVDIWLNDYMKDSLRKTTWESYETQFRNFKGVLKKAEIAPRKELSDESIESIL